MLGIFTRKYSMTFRGIAKSTNYFRKYWKNRKIDWHEGYFTPEHPHRQLIIDALKQFKFRSVLEVGCGAGANLYKIKQNFPNVDVGGLDWNAAAIEEAKVMLPRVAVLQVGEANDIFLSDRGADILLSDHCLIYLDSANVNKAIKEFKRIARNGIVLCEFHSANFFKRLLIKLTSGYNTYDYQKLLKKYGFYDIEITPLSVKDWPDTEKENGLRCIITARQ